MTEVQSDNKLNTDAPKETNNKNGETKADVNPCLFTPKEVLKSGRLACVQGEIHGERSLILLEHKEFSPSDLLGDQYTGTDVKYEQIFHNDIYSRYILYPKPSNGLKATIVSPCTQKHIDKYRQHNSYMILETPSVYQEITLPHLKQDQFNLQWLYNIFSGEKEADRILYRDAEEDEKGIILLPDLHWDGVDPNHLHLLAVPLKRGILSIRDLTNKHLPLLYHIRDKTIEIVHKKYGFKKEHLRFYFHYQPTFYHLHVHITYLHHEAPGIFTEKAHLLDTVIDNIELISDYYQRASIPFTVRETDSLFSKFKDLGIISDHVLVKNRVKMDLIKHIIVEIRPRLCSCSVVIVTNTRLSEKSLNISIRPNHIIINQSDDQFTKKKAAAKKQKILRRDSSSSYESYSDSEDEKYLQSRFVNVSSYCKLIPNSLSSLKVENNFMSFRILTEPTGPNSSGTIYNEVLSDVNSKIVNDNKKDYCFHEKLPIQLPESVSVKLQCSNCSSDVFDAAGLSFNRILELPSGNMDMSDWFCHNHGHCENDEEKNDEKKNSMVPSRNDVFYGLGYFLVNYCNVKKRLVEFNKKRDLVNCERCFSCIGSKSQKATCYRFWDSCVKFVNDSASHESFHFFHKVTQTESKNIALENFLHIIKYAIKTSIIDTVTSTCKIILECKISDDVTKSMLIWIMDKNLHVLKSDLNCESETNKNEIKLDYIFTSKLLYKCDESSDVLKNWLNDPCVQTFEISKDMMLEGNKHLSEMSNYIPVSFRKSNEFFVSYLKI